MLIHYDDIRETDLSRLTKAEYFRYWSCDICGKNRNCQIDVTSANRLYRNVFKKTNFSFALPTELLKINGKYIRKYPVKCIF